MKNSSYLRVLGISDLHLGHRRTETAHILENLYTYFHPWIDKADLVIIAGDVFDRLLTLPNEEVAAIHDWIGDLLLRCREHHVKLRVLEGTPSHDWQQSQLFHRINRLGIHADARWIRELTVEDIEDLGISIGYIPDEWDEPQRTYWQFQELLAQEDRSGVDWLAMHGTMDYQLPNIQQIPKHDSKSYQQLVNHYAFIGHIHTPNQQGNLLNPGSFDRLAHNEEHTKGFWVVDLDRSRSDDRITFVENDRARTYRTIDLRGYDRESAWQIATEIANEAEFQAHLSLHIRKGEAIQDLVGELKRQYSLLNFDLKTEQASKRSFEQLDQLKPHKKEPIRPNTVSRLVHDKLVDKGYSQAHIQACLQELESWLETDSSTP